MAKTRPAGLPDIDARAPEGTPEREAQRRRAACLATPYAGGRPMDPMADTQAPEASVRVEKSVIKILADRRKKAAAKTVERQN